MATPSEIDEIKRRLSILDVAGRYIKVNKAGRNFKALCPFHSEKTPSFMLNPELNIYKCFGCGESGDIFSFVEKIEGIGFGEALESLAAQAGVQLSKGGGDNRQAQERKSWYEVLALVTRLYEDFLWKHPGGSAARDYLKSRGIAEKTARAFQLGYAPDAWETLVAELPKRGYSLATLEKLGLVIASDRKPGAYYDRFRDRLLFPVTDSQGRVVGYSGRTMAAEGGGAKYINSPETPLFRKSELLYGYHLAKGAIRLAEEMVLVEGNFDVVQLHQAGQATAVAPLGTALTAEHLKLAKRLAQKIFLAFDGDSAGAKATLASLELAENEGLDVRVIVLPPGNDPDSLIRNEPERWPKLKENALPVIEYRIRQILGAEDLNASVGKTRAADAAMALIRRLSSDVSRAHYVEKVASALHIPQDVLLQQLRRGGAPQRQSAGYRQPAGQRQPVSTQPVWPPTEFELIKLLLRTPHLIDRLGEVNADWLTHPDVAEIVAGLRDLTAKNFQYDGFYASVTPEQRQVISTVAFSQEADDYADADPAVDFEAICRRLEVRYLEQYLRQLREQTASAERDGDDQRLAGLQLEQSQLVIKLHQLREYS